MAKPDSMLYYAQWCWCWCFAVVGLVLLGSCSREPKLYPVSGSISLDGQPVSDGDILFLSADGARGPDPGQIKNGKYELKTTAGSKRVQISVSKIRPGGARGAGGEPVPEEYIPARFNLESELTADVQKAAENVANFDLKSK